MFEEESKVYKIFISYLNQEDDGYDTFISKLSSSYDFQFKNYGDPQKLKQINDQIAFSNVFIFLSGLYNKNKPVIKKQLDIAIIFNKPVIVIRPYGMEDVPKELENIANDVIGWNAPCIIDSIKEYYPLDN